MKIPGRLLPGESHNAPFFPSILLSGHAAGEKKAAADAKLLNRPEGQGARKKKGRREKSQRPLVEL
jgi:hypothetical protein